MGNIRELDILNNLKYLVVGGDERLAYLALQLKLENKDIKVIFGDEFKNILDKNILSQDWKKDLEDRDVIIFPLPISKDGKNLNHMTDQKIELYEIIEKISPDLNKNKNKSKIVFGGGINTEVEKLFESKQIKIIDYLKREELSVLNAMITAEGALEIAMRRLPISIYDSNCLITGFGRVSKALVKILNALGAKVTVVARKQGDLTWAKVYGCQSCNIKNLAEISKEQDVIFNTVPSQVIDSHVLKQTKKDCLIIDLASSPGGVDFEKANELGISAELALALPGKVAPKTSGLIIKETIDNILIDNIFDK